MRRRTRDTEAPVGPLVLEAPRNLTCSTTISSSRCFKIWISGRIAWLSSITLRVYQVLTDTRAAMRRIEKEVPPSTHTARPKTLCSAPAPSAPWARLASSTRSSRRAKSSEREGYRGAVLAPSWVPKKKSAWRCQSQRSFSSGIQVLRAVPRARCLRASARTYKGRKRDSWAELTRGPSWSSCHRRSWIIMLLSHFLTRLAMRTLQTIPWCRLRPSGSRMASGHTPGCQSRSDPLSLPKMGKSNSSQGFVFKKQMRSSVSIKKRNSRPRNIWKLIQAQTHMITYRR